jgi:flagellar biosynthesis/type III secretory pathway M-ring protein FliF/YscJ
LALDARGTTDLAVQTDLIWIVAAAVFAILVVRFASKGLLRRRECRDYKKNKSHSEKAEKRIESHELAPVKSEDSSAEPGRASRKRRGMCALSVTQRERI